MDSTTTPLIILKELAGNQPASLNAVQVMFADHADTLTIFWFFMWCVTVIILIAYTVREYKRASSNNVAGE